VLGRDGKVTQPKFLRCPVAECNGFNPKKFYLKAPALRTQAVDPNEIIDERFTQQDNALSRAQAQRDAHMVAFHPDVAISMGIPGAER